MKRLRPRLIAASGIFGSRFDPTKCLKNKLNGFI